MLGRYSQLLSGGSFLPFICSCLENISLVEGRFAVQLHDHTRPRASAGGENVPLCRGFALECLQRAFSHVVTFSKNSTCIVCCVFACFQQKPSFYSERQFSRRQLGQPNPTQQSSNWQNNFDKCASSLTYVSSVIIIITIIIIITLSRRNLSAFGRGMSGIHVCDYHPI